MDGQKRIHVFICGRVQGVYFRDSTRAEAVKSGVTGWVRNLPDGRVEAIFEGDEQAVDGLVSWCRSGPPNAIVTHVDAHSEPYRGQCSVFTIR